MFPSFDDQEYVLKRIGGFKQQVQLEILKRSGGDIAKIDMLVDQALGGCFNIVICPGLEECPLIPEECRKEVIQLVAKTKSSAPLIQDIPEKTIEGN